MRCSSVLASLFAAASAAAAGVNVVPGAYIFEFEDSGDTADFSAQAISDGKERMRFDYKLFKGVSIQFHNLETADEKAAKLAQLPAVKASWPVRMYSVPKPKVEWVGKPGKDYAGLVKRADDKESDTFSSHVMTQVDQLRKEGITGKGIKVAVVDTGIDYGHPALGGCFGHDCLVSFGTDLVGDDYNGYNKPAPDSDPMDCQGHGTHVAGIVAAQKNPFGFTGSAPDVKLGAYRVFGCDGEASNDILIAAFNQAFEDGADIITASIGGPSGWSEDPWSAAVSRIVDHGTPCTISAGNEGDKGIFYSSGAANGLSVSAIASFDNVKTPSLLTLSHFTVDGGSKEEFGYTPGEPEAWDGVTLPLWAVNFDTSDPAGGCDPYPANTPDLSGFIVLVRRGSCTFVQKAQNAAKAGAKYIIVYNNAAGSQSIAVSEVTAIKAAGMVDNTQGAAWISSLKAGKKVVLEMGGTKGGYKLIENVNNQTGGALSTFTTWGPTWEMGLKPQFGAVGGNVLSTYPRKKGSYAVISGTSMSCPQTAAIYALITQVRGKIKPAEIENLLASNANPQLFNDGTAFAKYLAPVPQQGAGLVQAYDAAHATTLLSHSGLSFNDTDHFIQSLNFTISNTGKKEITYDISHIPAITMYTLGKGSINVELFPNEAIDKSASFKMSESKVTLAAGKNVVIEVVPTPPEGLDAKRLALWSGYFAINGTDGTSLSIPYQGLTGSLHDSQVLASNGGFMSRLTDDATNRVAANKTFILPPAGSVDNAARVELLKRFANVTSVSIPQVAWNLSLGSSQLRADIVSLGKELESEDVFGTKSVGQPAGFPSMWTPRGLAGVPWVGELASGEYLPEGSYKIIYRALRIFGDAKKKEEWDVAEGEPFNIKYKGAPCKNATIAG